MNADARPLVVIPTYCEAASLPELLNLLLPLQPPVDVLVVDDSSPDGTAQAVRQLQEFGRRVYLLERPRKQGLGSAYREGFQWGLARNYPVVIEMDADLSQPVAQAGPELKPPQLGEGRREGLLEHVIDFRVPITEDMDAGAPQPIPVEPDQELLGGGIAR